MFKARFQLLWVALLALSSVVSLGYAGERRPVLSSDRALACRASLMHGVLVKQTPMGPRVFSKADPWGTRDIRDLNWLRIGQYNVFNLYNYRGQWVYDRFQGQRVWKTHPRQKPEKRWESLRDTILRSDDDIMVWEEVEDVGAAEDFVESHLDGKYRIVQIPGNDERGIDIALLIKNDLPFDVEVQSYREMRLESTQPGSNITGKIFSRDLPVAEFKKKFSKPEDPPLLVIAGTHYKSQRDSSGDPRSVRKRTRQVNATVRILSEMEQRYPEVPIFLAGDFNANLHTGVEFKPLWEAGFKDGFDLGEDLVPHEERVTHTFHPHGQGTSYSQLDGILASKAAQKHGIVLRTEVIPYLDRNGARRPYPDSIREREEQGSDHWKLRMTIDFKKLLQRLPKNYHSAVTRFYDTGFYFPVREVVAFQCLYACAKA